MFLLGLLLPICFVPGYTSAIIPAQWAVLSILLPLVLWRRAPFGFFHRLGILFILYSILSISWANSIYSSVLGLWYLSIWAMSFWLGSSTRDLTSLWKGLAIGLSASSAVALGQFWGFTLAPTLIYSYAGLLYNTNIQGACIALVLIACLSHRLWWYTPLLWIGLALSESRGAIGLVAIYLLIRYVHWLVALALVVAGTFYVTGFVSLSDALRLKIWIVAIHGLSWFGWGPDSFNDVFAVIYDHLRDRNDLTHLEFVHNDYLQLWFEYGLGALLPFAIYLGALTQHHSPTWPVFLAFALLGLFFFPLYAPIPAFIGAVAAGNLLRGVDPIRALGDLRRSARVQRFPTVQSASILARREGFPLAP